MAKNRQNFIIANKYQRPLILLPVVSSFILTSLLTVLIIFYQKDFIISLTNSQSAILNAEIIQKWGIFMILNIWIFFLIVVIYSFLVASNTVGPFERIINQLRDGLQKNKPKPLTARKDDYLAQELIKPINELIEHYDPQKVKKNIPLGSINKIKLL